MNKTYKAIPMILALCIAVTANAQENRVTVRLNGCEISSRALLSEDRVLVPFRDVFESLGYDVKWESGNIYADDGEISMMLRVGSSQAEVDDGNEKNTVDCGTDIKIINDTAYVPVRAVAETTGAQVEWDGYGKTVDIYGSADIPELKQNETEVMLDYPVAYSFEDKDLKYIENFIIRNIDDKFDIKNFDIKENSLTWVNGRAVFGVLSLNYVKNGFVTDWGYDFYVQNGLASKLVIMGDPSDTDVTDLPELADYTDSELKEMALKEIRLQKNEEITEQRVLRKYRDGKYICAVVTEITNRSSGISRGEYFELVL